MSEKLDVFVRDAVPGATPLEVLSCLCASGVEDVVLLHSAAGDSVLAFEPLVMLEVDCEGVGRVSGRRVLEERREKGEPLEMLERVVGGVEFDVPHGLVGWLGFVGYDIGRTLEVIGESAREELRWPLLRFGLYRNYLLHDPVTKRWTPVGIDGDAEPLEELLRRSQNGFVEVGEVGPGRVVEGISAEIYRGKIERVKEYIAAGDVYQVNLAQRWRVETKGAGEDIYRRLCLGSPAPYAGFMRFVCGDGVRREVMSASPELFLNVSEGRVVTRPIKGTRRRDVGDAGRDMEKCVELLESEKDKAELAMIVDLLRNDLGRVAEFGTVEVEAARELEEHPTVWHTVATVVGRLRGGGDGGDGVGLAELLRAVCPGGSITGAPKIRAMQIIEELEGFRRGLYCGNMGVIGSLGKSLTLNIAIRTILLQEGVANVFAGGGIVADSEAGAEYQETLDKAAAMFRALGVGDELPRPRSER